MTRRAVMQYLAGLVVAVRGHAPVKNSTTKFEEGWALMDADGTYRTRSMVGMPDHRATLFTEYEVDGYAKVWGSQKVWLRRTITTSCEMECRPPQLSAL